MVIGRLQNLSAGELSDQEIGLVNQDREMLGTDPEGGLSVLQRQQRRDGRRAAAGDAGLHRG